MCPPNWRAKLSQTRALRVIEFWLAARDLVVVRDFVAREPEDRDPPRLAVRAPDVDFVLDAMMA
ncbi:MAG: hypothetical protein ACOYN3_08065 [Acidimicrobiia bacterium]